MLLKDNKKSSPSDLEVLPASHIVPSAVFVDEKAGDNQPPDEPFEDGKYINKTLVHALQLNAKRSPDHVMIEWVNNQCKVEASVTYKELWNQSALVAMLLLKNGIKRGDRVMIAYPFGLEFLSGMFGCMRIGVIACSVYPPNIFDKSKARFSFEQFNNQVKDAGARFALTSTLFKRGLFVAALSGHKTGSLKWLATDKLKKKHQMAGTEVDSFQVSSNDIAFIQYSSGSTGSPKGVVITHGAIMHNISCVVDVIGDTGANRGVSWLPQYHDYGLVLFYLLPCVSVRNLSVSCSPLDFIRNPLLWADMIEKFSATHIAGPNFAYELLARRMKAANRAFSNKTTLFQANIAAEPIAPATLAAMKDIGIPASAVMPCYGLAEVCVYATTCIGDEVHITEEGVVSCGLMERNEAKGKFIRIASDSGQILDEGDVGEIYIRGPDLTPGYWAKPDDLHASLHCKLSDGDEYFATGDLGKIIAGRLYVVCRSKELIIVNGKNVYPQDVERAIESEYPVIVRPGSTVAFQNTGTDIGVALEIRRAYKSLNDVPKEFCETSIRRLVSNACGVVIGDLKMLKEGSVPKTTSGKLKRVETRRLALEGGLPTDKILYDSKTKSASSTIKSQATIGGDVAVETTRDCDQADNDLPSAAQVEVPHNLGTSTLPKSLLGAIANVEMKSEKLNEIFVDLRLDEHPELVSKWKSMEKTASSLQLMCESVKQGVLSNLPSVVQFAHLLDRNRDWLPPNAEEVLSDTLHFMFVQDFATRELCGDSDLFGRKIESDQVYEDWLCRGMTRNQVPDDAQFLLENGKVDDPLFGRFDSFSWMKRTSVTKFAKSCLEWMHRNQPFKKHEGINLLELNILEAAWMDKKKQLTENGCVGHWLFQRASDPIASSQGVELRWGHDHSSWSQVYKAWNLCFVAGMSGDPPSLLGKLLFPTLLHASNEKFMSCRTTSLYCVAQLQTRRFLSGSFLPPILSWEALKAFGILNQRWVKSLGTEDFPGIPMTMENEWLLRFDKWHQSTLACHVRESVVETVADGFLNGYGIDQDKGDGCSVGGTFYSLLGPDIDMLASWDLNGLTSLLHAELISRVQESHQVTLPINFQLQYQTPAELKRFIEASSAQRFPVKLPDLTSTQNLRDKRASLSVGTLSILQAGSVLLMIATFAINLLPAFFVGKYASSFRTVFEVGGSGRYVSWSWLPLAVPTFFTTLSLTVVLLKWIVIGRYRAGAMEMPSLNYFRWWFVDRLVHMWEVWVGYYILDTKLMWLFYRLMGADVSLSCQLNGFLREFDLISVGPHSSIHHQVRCRKFARTDERSTVEFRPIQIGSNCIVEGVVEVGVRLCDGSRVDRTSAVSAGSQVPPSTVARGSPAYNAGTSDTQVVNAGFSCAIEAAKLCWLFSELYIFFALFLVSQVILNQQLPPLWRYTPLLYWGLLLPLTSLLGLLLSTVMKWILIGRRTLDHSETLYRTAVYWICDYHFKVSCMLIIALFPHSRVLFNGMLWLHGMDIDMSSFLLDCTYLPPSKVDLVKVKNSFVSARIHFEPGGKIEIVDSSIGLGVSIGKGVKIRGTTVRPQVNVRESVNDAISGPRPVQSIWKLIAQEAACCCIPILGFVSLIPAFEVFNAVVYDQRVGVAVCGLVASVVVQLVTWTSLLWLVQRLVLFRGKKMWFPVYINLVGILSIYTMWFLLWGSPLYGYLLRFMGARVEGELWYFGYACYDFSFLTFEDGTIVDNALIIGHYQVYDQLVVGPTRVGGVFQPYSYVYAGGVALNGGLPFQVALRPTSVETDTESSSQEDGDIENQRYNRH